MCGIAGFVDFGGHAEDAAAARVKRMTRVLLHRGPDAGGVYVDRFAALGHRRLSIIDVASGRQPMGTADGQVQIVFNGEIYNFLEIRDALERKGASFETRSDTEVILQAYLEWGEACVERLDGMFAFAIWDARHKQLLLARDRVGKKPLYYHRSGNVLAFASELKALRAANLCPDELDPESLDCYLSLGYIPAPRTIYRNVSKLRPARVLTATEPTQREREYWQLRFDGERNRRLEEEVEELEALLDEAVRCRLVSEVPIGAFLSGGLDSSLVVSSMSKLLDSPVATHSIGFRPGEQSELPTARVIADFLGTDHHEFVVEPSAADVLSEIAWHVDEPLADSSALPTWYVCRETRASVTVALSGDGGDEAFGGYTFRYLPHLAESRVRGILPASLRAAVFGPLGHAWPASARLPKALRLKTIFENLAVGDAEAFYRDLAWLREDARRRVYRPDFLDCLKGFTPFETVRPYYLRSDTKDALARSQHADMQVYMTDDVLAKVDRMSMAHSLEVRCPLLDHRILEFAAGLPARHKISLGSGKRVLRQLAARRLPPKVRALPKRGFSVPVGAWLRGELREAFEDVLRRPGRFVSSALNEKETEALWQDHQNGSRDHSVFLWAVMMLNLWERAMDEGVGKAAAMSGAEP